MIKLIGPNLATLRVQNLLSSYFRSNQEGYFRVSSLGKLCYCGASERGPSKSKENKVSHFIHLEFLFALNV